MPKETYPLPRGVTREGTPYRDIYCIWMQYCNPAHTLSYHKFYIDERSTRSRERASERGKNIVNAVFLVLKTVSAQYRKLVVVMTVKYWRRLAKFLEASPAFFTSLDSS